MKVVCALGASSAWTKPHTLLPSEAFVKSTLTVKNEREAHVTVHVLEGKGLRRYVVRCLSLTRDARRPRSAVRRRVRISSWQT
jgi:ribosomal protein S12